MTAIQLREELFREMNPLLDSEVAMTKVIAFVKGLVNVQKKVDGPRSGWAAAAQQAHQDGEDKLMADDACLFIFFFILLWSIPSFAGNCARIVCSLFVLLPFLGEYWLRTVPKALPWADLFWPSRPCLPRPSIPPSLGPG